MYDILCTTFYNNKRIQKNLPQ